MDFWKKKHKSTIFQWKWPETKRKKKKKWFNSLADHRAREPRAMTVILLHQILSKVLFIQISSNPKTLTTFEIDFYKKWPNQNGFWWFRRFSWFTHTSTFFNLQLIKLKDGKTRYRFEFKETLNKKNVLTSDCDIQLKAGN